MITVNVTIVGTTALLQHRFSENAEAAKQTRKVNIQERDPREEAETVSYRLPDGSLYFPGAAIGRLLREAGGSHKQRGSRKSLKYVIPAATLVMTDAIRLHAPDSEEVLNNFEVDSRPVQIPATKGRIMRHRPRLNGWAATFDIRIDETILSSETIHQLLSEGGQQIGIGDFRPEKGGPFGTFRVVKFQESKKAA